MRFSFIDAKKVEFPVARLCETLEVSQSGYFAWKSRPAVKASARTWYCLLISGSVFACRGRLMEARACTLISLRTVSSPDATGLPG